MRVVSSRRSTPAVCGNMRILFVSSRQRAQTCGLRLFPARSSDTNLMRFTYRQMASEWVLNEMPAVRGRQANGMDGRPLLPVRQRNTH